jgi:hypothetical protein
MYKSALFLALCLLCSCHTKIKNFEKYEKIPFLETEIKPKPEEMENVTPNVLIGDFLDNDIEKSKELGIPGTFKGVITKTLISGKLANIVSRSDKEATQNEIKLTESQKNLTSSGIKSADYIISGETLSVSLSENDSVIMIPIQVGKNNFTAIPVKRRETEAEVSFSVKIQALPSLDVLETVIFSGSESKTETNPDSTQNGGVIKTAMDNAIKNGMPKFKEYFAKRGFIIEKRALPKKQNKPIFKINIGTNDGIQQDDSVLIQQIKPDDKIMGVKSEKTTLCRGKIADQNTEHTAWIVIKDKKCSQKIKMGDIAKLTYIE